MPGSYVVLCSYVSHTLLIWITPRHISKVSCSTNYGWYSYKSGKL